MRNSVKFNFINGLGVSVFCELELLTKSDNLADLNPRYLEWCLYCDELLYRNKYLRDYLNIAKSYFDFVRRALFSILYKYANAGDFIGFTLGDYSYRLSDFIDFTDKLNLSYKINDFVDYIFDCLINHSYNMED